MTEYFYSHGYIPLRFYNQLNNRTADENYRQNRFRFENWKRAERELEAYKSRRKAEIDAELEEQLNEELPKAIQAAFNELFKSLP